MNDSLSPNAKAILLLTAPLIIGRGKASDELLTHGQYKQLAHQLRERALQPADLLGPNGAALCDALDTVLGPKISGDRLRALLDRGFQLSQAIERWRARAIWVVSRADSGYPQRIRSRLKDDAPAVLYGCGNVDLLETGGLAVVGSRHVDEQLVEYTKAIGQLAANAGRCLVSGGARGIDQAAMNGALEADGKAIGILADKLESAVVNRAHRDLLLDERLVLVSPYDPAAGFNVGNAMQRNKIVYAVADAALVVSSDHNKGGTWAGASEQLKKYRFGPIYVRATGAPSEGLQALAQAGARPWPEPETSGELIELLDRPPSPRTVPSRTDESQAIDGAPHASVSGALASSSTTFIHTETAPAGASATPADTLFSTVRTLLKEIATPQTDTEIAEALDVSKAQAKQWLNRLVEEGVLEKTQRPIRYRPATKYPRQHQLFG
jgi:predicted Rossmann fold nucleotide-binding protein DprA/Smf involved in DNA uptake